MTRVLILGGYGTSGGRLARLLADDARLTLLIAGRSYAAAEDFCAGLGGAARREPLKFDRTGYVLAQLRDTTPEMVVDASGPFQIYGDDPYVVVKACIALKIPYLDLADGAAFVDGIAAFDGEAKAQNIFVLSGVSSFPVLTAAVVRELSADMAQVDSVTAGVAPSPFADIGLNVLRAIASYAGKPLAIPRDGRKTTAYAILDFLPFTIAPPGRLPLLPRRFTLVEVPDLEVLPALFPTLKTVWVGAGMVPAVLHRALSGLASLVRLRILRSLLPFADWMHRSRRWLRWGEHRGGMFVAVAGTAAGGHRVTREWHMIAEGDDGPFIPSMAAAAVVRRVLDGDRPAAGARAGTTDVTLADYAAQFATRRIFTGVREPAPQTAPLYRRILGPAYEALPEPVRRLHDLEGESVAEGHATIGRGDGWIVRRIAAAFGFPPAGDDVPVTVEFRRESGREVWRRNFGGQMFSSLQEEGRGRFDRLLCERFGPCAFALALVVDDGHLRLILRRWSVSGFAMPLWLAPACVAYESGEGGRFRFFVELRYRFLGLIVRYQGWLQLRREPAASSDSGAAK
jgi:Domain of unknown function (DUF4166)/Saccharopine dehydrogenase NADP binding domain